ncbi:MAG: hypothetical protein ACKO23_07995 [Gemmataceae bacterium]
MAKKVASSSSKPAKSAKPAAKSAKPAAKSAKRVRWFDPKTHAPLLNEYAGEMESFLKAMADGVIEEGELKEQEKDIVALMKEIEPKLDDDLHAKVTRLLCEITVYDMMQMAFTMQENRPSAKFKG